jgi:hypothetical protein
MKPNGCQNFQRHGDSIIPPEQLSAMDITVERYVQRPGTYFVVPPGAVRIRADLGFACLEKACFAPEGWEARAADQYTTCEHDKLSVFDTRFSLF